MDCILYQYFSIFQTANKVPDIKVMLDNELFEIQSDMVAKDFLSQDKVKLEILSMAFDIDVNPPSLPFSKYRLTLH